LIDIAGRSVLIVDRFDRTAFGYRIGYASALTMLEASDGDRRSYVDIAEVVEERSSRTSADLVELWRRVVFSVLISNTDDHLRNHAFLHTAGDSWVLSPAFDINPDPSMGPKELSTSITDYEFSARLEPLLEVAELFRLTRDDAVSVIKAVAAVVSGWREHASSVGLSRLEIDRMEPAFVHAASEDVATL